MSSSKPGITPDTKVADLLRDYPALEERLLQLSPTFAALKNPVLRRTVARVTSLQQAAKVANIPVVEMVNALRREAGLATMEESFCPGGGEEALPLAANAPAKVVTVTMDVRPIIDAGDHPKDAVLAQAEQLLPGECLELIAPFPPAPLISLLQQRGFTVTMLPPQEGLVRTFVER